jgi:hypothetical protein
MIVADPGKLTLGEPHREDGGVPAADGARHDVLQEGVTDRLITFRWTPTTHGKGGEDAGRQGRHAAAPARRTDEAARH